jgi:hypothetical protein
VDGQHRHTSWSRKAGDIEDRSRRDADIKPGHPVELPHTAMFTGR